MQSRGSGRIVQVVCGEAHSDPAPHPYSTDAHSNSRPNWQPYTLPLTCTISYSIPGAGYAITHTKSVAASNFGPLQGAGVQPH